MVDKCIWCHREVSGEQKYCSKECKEKDLKRREKIKNVLRESRKTKALERETEYLQDPVLCKNCGKPLPYLKRKALFCNSSCAATYRNLKRGKGVVHWSEEKKKAFSERQKVRYSTTLEEAVCKYCGKPLGKIVNSRFKEGVCEECRPFLGKLSTYQKIGLLEGSLKERDNQFQNLLKQEYLTQDVTISDLCRKYHIYDVTVRNALKNCGVSLQGLSTAHKILAKRLAEARGIPVTEEQIFKHCAKQLGISSDKENFKEEVKEELCNLYFEQKVTAKSIANSLGILQKHLFFVLKAAGKKPRTKTEVFQQCIPKNTGFKTGTVCSWQGDSFVYRSSWEKEYALHLNELKEPYVMEFSWIRYFSTKEGIYRYAIPDFYFPESNTLLEIKSPFRQEYWIQPLRDKFKEYLRRGFNVIFIYNKQECDVQRFIQTGEIICINKDQYGWLAQSRVQVSKT